MVSSFLMPGVLFVVATPIGNLEDASPRALRTLRECDWIACEDTRRTSRLLAKFGIERPLISCHEFNEKSRIEPVLGFLRDGKLVALVSDGGTPGISDPGALLVAAAVAETIPVVPIPGPSAPIALLSVSGFGGDRFVFDGFLPPRAGERRRRLRELRSERRTLVLFESPHRIAGSLEDLTEIFGNRRLVVGRELTKQFETIYRGTAAGILQRLQSDETRGEFVLVLEGAPEAETAVTDGGADRIRETWRRALETSGGDRRRALRSAARETGLDRAELHRRLVELGEDVSGRS